ncbi:MULTISPECIES: bifunctional phosphopantothenoylcysteine decarboxylase/phosphopantothenate--cysteine ligase CoaBC [Sphingomonas]|uniref:bifunctional phosphopantothenoylcysteine decarboxylase/phosphopantothenate--cysteine ligase CoaBC n=1 Tax=Sphingomonas TaxID=13687 RepID=UPI00208E30D6|nr:MULTISPECIES: bifunctional phosphopantothenoylcysteine decarboxylase/phosphopantothenate--cysteine ligase CoaBC [Sphingomonas]MDY0968491.1 bifunctional phosphopantothenoylcysteine decarboxylase/phosphopantothenate--cysteine ligase CoaBC [Sphingomonas sp. CFBP9021]USR01621.1 bifunctional phosphopantothenoylcysteine decarboxylase/phosphopantothenate--cysteine ligase CoaBC [Sphingomonas aerolata]
MKRILLIVGGGIAAYKASELVRLLRKRGHAVRCVLTEAGQHFVTPMTLAALSEDKVYTTLWDLKDEAEMGHIQLSRQADLIVVAPATADLIARMAGGLANDLATTLLLATDKPVLAAPAMNVRMWLHPATVRNVAQLRADGITVMAPDEGPMACGEFGPGRLPEPDRIADAIDAALEAKPQRLAGRHILVTAGPTHEPIDPVRYIANRSSGRQGFAIAGALAALGARVTLVAGPVTLPTPAGTTRIDVETAREMADAVDRALPVDAAIMVAAVADWHVDAAVQKIKKGDATPTLALSENPDILATLARSRQRPALLIGFAAETERVVEHATAKRARKDVDWIVANDVSGDVMGGDSNSVHIVTKDGVESWPRQGKDAVAAQLARRVADALEPAQPMR